MPKPEIDGQTREWERGDVLQITNLDHYCFPALFIVRKPTSYGVKAYGFHISGEGSDTIYINLNNDDIELIGSAVLVEKEENND